MSGARGHGDMDCIEYRTVDAVRHLSMQCNKRIDALNRLLPVLPS